MEECIVYQHRRLDTNEIFYIGIGKCKRRKNSKYSRNQFWWNIVNKHGYSIEVIHENLLWEDACLIEKQLIKQYGRIDLKTGILCNMTDGGDGLNNISNELRQKIGQKKGFKHSKESKLKISNSEKGEKHYRYGTKVSNDIRNKISNSLIGKYCGEKNPTSKLTDKDVIWIRQNYIKRDKEFGITPLSKKFNISNGNIDFILKGKTWKHLI